MKRREFIPRITGGAAIVAVSPVVMTSCEKENPEPDNRDDDIGGIDLDDPNFVGLKSDGGFAYKGPYIVINTGDENFIALSSSCTHNACRVNYSISSNNLPCPCHGSVFAIDGVVLQGPASSPLKTYKVEREGNILTIS